MFPSGTPIPHELLSTTASEGDISILIGENGSGKSQLLGELTRQYLGQGKKVIAISNSIHDKFPDSGRNLHLLRDRAGRKKARRSIKHSLLHISPEEITRFKNVSKALSYVGYDPVIGIERINISEMHLDEALKEKREGSKDMGSPDDLSARIDLDPSLDNLRSLLLKSSSISSESIVWLSLNDFSFYELDRVSLIQLLQYESLLKKLNLIQQIQLYLRKKDQIIELYDASSGELNFISTIIYLSTVINENCAILIDEPENSLHPSWQKDYIRLLIELFYLYQPKIVAATHSALILTGAEVANPTTIVFECHNFQFARKTKEPINIEEAFYNYFNVITPENRFLSEFIVDELNKLAEKKINYDSFLTEINALQEKAFEPKQISLFDGLREIALKIVDSAN
ncbi:MAG: hypothetical protein BGO55_11715 [Sphingobacteriales bacterium 50-39]|nr:ATP-binding protein [Sphingobacteriales bacterium]OJW54355.1 MAG: hypothetical protein BGO55_11715 [Sphingobacteriales bacterium 50-39]